MKYLVAIRQTLVHEVHVEAPNEGRAIREAMNTIDYWLTGSEDLRNNVKTFNESTYATQVYIEGKADAGTVQENARPGSPLADQG